MKVNFNNIDFESFEPHREIYYNGKKFKVIDVSVVLNDGSIEDYIIAERNLYKTMLEETMKRNPKATDLEFGSKEEDIDDSISFFCEPTDKIYYVLECITGETIA